MYQVQRPNGEKPFEDDFASLQEVTEIVDTQAYYMHRQYRVIDLQTGKEVYRTNQ